MIAETLRQKKDRLRATMHILTPLAQEVDECVTKRTPMTPAAFAKLVAISGSQNLETQLNALEETKDKTEEELNKVWVELARGSYHDFYEFMNRNEGENEEGYTMSPHQVLIGDLLMESFRKETMRFMLSLPPGHTKSTHSSHHFPAFWLGHNPRRIFLQAGHGQSFVANELGAKVKSIVSSEDYQMVFPNVKISNDMKAKDYWALTNRKGKYIARGAGQGISGFRGHYGMVDDPYASRKDAESPVVRADVFKWYSDDFSTRLLPGSPLGIIMCMVGGTPVTMADGTHKRIDKVRVGDFVKTWSNGAYATRQVTKASCQGVDAIYEIRTQSSRVRCNARHPFLLQRENGVQWVRAGDIALGDRIVTAARDDTFEATTLTVDEAWALGFMFGDGWVTKNVKRNKNPRRAGKRCNPTASWVTCVAACPAYPERHDRAMRVLSAKFDAKFVYKEKERYYRTEKAKLGRWLYDLGLAAGAKGKRVPPFLFSECWSVRNAFLEGFMGADGCNAGAGNYSVKQATLANKSLVRDLRHLARSLGYRVTNISQQNTFIKPPNSPKAKWWKSWNFEYHHEKTPSGPFTGSTVTDVCHIGYDKVYDLTIAEDECFIADGIVSHNTRWHSDDICGRITDRENREILEQQEKRTQELINNAEAAEGNQSKYRFKIINLPAIAEDIDDPLGRAIGEPLWSEVYDISALENLRADMTPASWNSLYQGTPMDISGGTVTSEWFRRYDDLPAKADPEKQTPSRIRRITVSVDAANTAKERSDFSVIQVWIEDLDRKHYLADSFRKQIEFTELCTQIDAICQRWEKIAGRIDALLVEAKGNGLAYCQLKEKGGAPAPLIPIEVGTASKEFRFDEVSPMFEAGTIYLPHKASWLPDYEKELVAFPNGKHDDQVDATSQYLKWARSKQRRGNKKLKGLGNR